MKSPGIKPFFLVLSIIVATFCTVLIQSDDSRARGGGGKNGFDGIDAFFGRPDPTARNAAALLRKGRDVFRHDTFGDEAFWGDQLQLHLAIKGEALGGVGEGVSPNTALALGLKVDSESLPDELVESIQQGELDLDDPAVTVELLRRNAVVGVKGFFDGNDSDDARRHGGDDEQENEGALVSVGLTCAVCHSTVDNRVAFGVGRRLDGYANRDLDSGAIIAAAPNVSPFTSLLAIVQPGITDDQVRDVLRSWGPGKFDAELSLDGKAFNPQQVTNGVVTATNVSGATLIPNAFDMGGINEHTWTGGWGTTTYWNAFVAVLELHGIGTFHDPRLDDAAKWPIAAAAGFGHITVAPEDDRVSPVLPALHYYQLALPAPKPRRDVDYDGDAADDGRDVFHGKADCDSCHTSKLWTEPGHNTHTPEEMKIDSFQADRSPDETYKTSNLSALFVRERGLFMDPANAGRFYHDGRFATLADVVASYDERFELGLTDEEQSDLVEYLKSL